MKMSATVRCSNDSRSAFTLLEVMIALGIFFIALFAILGLVSQNLSSARILNQLVPTPGMVAAELSLTNKLVEGSQSGEFEEYPDYSWIADTEMYGTNGLFRMNVVVFKNGQEHSDMELLLFRPESNPVSGTAGGGTSGLGGGSSTGGRSGFNNSGRQQSGSGGGNRSGGNFQGGNREGNNGRLR